MFYRHLVYLEGGEDEDQAGGGEGAEEVDEEAVGASSRSADYAAVAVYLVVRGQNVTNYI